jgi:hypothetical protein
VILKNEQDMTTACSFLFLALRSFFKEVVEFSTESKVPATTTVILIK